MNIVITGSTGFIGSNLIKKLKPNHNILAIIRKSTNISFLKKNKIKYFVFNGNIKSLAKELSLFKTDCIIHLASCFLKDHQSSDIKELINSNLLFSTSLAEASVMSNVKWFINTGTFWQHYHSNNYSPVNLYAATKQAFYDITKFYEETKNINFIHIMLNDTFGPGDKRKKILNLLLDLTKKTGSINMSPGDQIVDICYIDNILNAYEQVIKLISSNKGDLIKNKVFSISANEKMTLKALVKLFEKVTDKKLNINWGELPYRNREVMVPWNQGEKIPGYKQTISLKKGIKLFTGKF